MAEYIDKSALYEKFAQLEELARNRYLETPSSSPGCSRYMTQLNERTAFKRIIADFPVADVAPVVRCKNCKHRYEDSWCEYVDDDDNFYCARGERKEGQA